MGNFFSAGLGFLSLILISRVLTVEDFGVFTVAASFMVMVQPIASVGLNTTVIKFMSSLLGKGESREAHQIFKTSLLGVIFFSSATAGVVLLAARPLSRMLFGDPGGSRFLRIAASGVISLALFYFVKAVICAFKKFGKLVSLQISVDLLKLALIGVLVLVSALTPLSAILVFVGTALLGALVCLWCFRSAFKEKIENVCHTLSSLLSYGFWVFAGAVFEGAFLYVGLLLLAGMLSAKEAGIYGLALNLSLIFPVLIITLRSVLLPETSQFTDKRQFENYLGITLKIFLGSLFLVVPLIFLATWLIPRLFGENYRDSITPFNWLMVSFVLYAVIKIICQALFALDRPKVVAIIEMARLTFMVVGSVALIPSLGAVAPAVMALISNAAVLFVSAGFSWSILQRMDQLPHAVRKDGGKC